MEQLISYWKDHPDIKHAFESGNRVLLGPFFIPVRHLFFVFAFFYVLGSCWFICFL